MSVAVLASSHTYDFLCHHKMLLDDNAATETYIFQIDTRWIDDSKREKTVYARAVLEDGIGTEIEVNPAVVRILTTDFILHFYRSLYGGVLGFGGWGSCYYCGYWTWNPSLFGDNGEELCT